MSGSVDIKFAKNAAAITVSDTDDLPNEATKGVYVGSVGGGTAVKVVTSGGDTVTVTVAAGDVIPLMVKQVFDTGTTASALVAMYDTRG